MKTFFSLLTFLCLSGMTSFAAVGQDTLLLLDGKIITGTIQDESITVLNDLQANINTWHTMIDPGDGKPLKIQNKDINYFIIGGVKYGNRHMPMGNKMVRIIVEGPASLYSRQGTVTQRHTHIDNISNPKFEVTTPTTQKVELDPYVEMVIQGKKMPYSMNISYITSHFAKIFDQCPKLIEESKKPGFDFSDLVAVTQRYNVLMAESSK